MKKEIKQDIEVQRANPISYSEKPVHQSKADLLHLELSSPPQVTKTENTKEVRRILSFIFDDGKYSDVAIVTKCVRKNNLGGFVTTFMVSWKGTFLEKRVREFVERYSMKAIWEELLQNKVMSKGFKDRDERLLAIVDTDGLQKKFYKCDRRKDLELLAQEYPELTYKIIDEKFGTEFNLKKLKYWTSKYPKADWEKIELLLTDKYFDARNTYREIARQLVQKSITSNDVKVDAKRLMSRVVGDRIWEED